MLHSIGKADENQSPEQLSRTFHYPVVKDLGKHVFALISGT